MCSPLEQLIEEQSNILCWNSLIVIKRHNPYLEKFKMRWHWKETTLKEYELSSEDLNPKLKDHAKGKKD